jgi:hypothetical protein
LFEVRQEWLDHFLSLEFYENKARDLVLYFIRDIYPHVPDEEIKVEFVDGPVEAQKTLNINPDLRSNLIDFRKFFFRIPVAARDCLRNYLTEVIFTEHKETILQQYHSFIDTFFSQNHELLRGVDNVSFVRDETVCKLLSGVVHEVSEQVLDLLEGMRLDQPFFPFWNRSLFSDVRNSVLVAAQTDMNKLFGSTGSDFPRFAHFVRHGSFSDFEWVSLYDGLQRCGIIEIEELSHYISLVKANAFFWIPSHECNIVCRPPLSLKFDDRNRLHCVNGPAVSFADGYKQYWVHGVNFDVKTFNQFLTGKECKPGKIFKLRNAEQRIALMQHFGFESVFDHIHNKRLINRDNCVSAVTGKRVSCELYDCELPGLDWIRLLKLEDHTTHKPVILTVPVGEGTDNCRKAIAWTFGMTEEEYAPLVET